MEEIEHVGVLAPYQWVKWKTTPLVLLLLCSWSSWFCWRNALKVFFCGFELEKRDMMMKLADPQQHYESSKWTQLLHGVVSKVWSYYHWYADYWLYQDYSYDDDSSFLAGHMIVPLLRLKIARQTHRSDECWMDLKEISFWDFVRRWGEVFWRTNLIIDKMAKIR